jgi:AcrR family transcriptional regulator
MILHLDRSFYIIELEFRLQRKEKEFTMPRLSKTRKAIVTAAMREAIYDAAASVLCKHGIGGTTMSRVAEAANVTKSNLYYYFRDKDELLQFFNTRLVEPCIKIIEEAAKSELPALQKLEKILRTTWEFASHHKGLIRLIVEGDQDSKIRRSVRPRVLGIFTAVVEQGIQEGVFRSHNPEHTGRMFNGALTELMELLAEGASDESVNDYVESLVDGVHYGFSIHAKKSLAPDGLSPNSSN